jgi:AhpD family alkylhydroperoxidase
MSGSGDQNRIQPIDPNHATGAIRRLFAEIRTNFALVPNLFRVLATAPAALEGFVGLGSALARGALDEKIREQLALAIAESNLCPYCLSAHTAMAAKIGLNQAEIDDSRERGGRENRCHPQTRAQHRRSAW